MTIAHRRQPIHLSFPLVGGARVAPRPGSIRAKRLGLTLEEIATLANALGQNEDCAITHDALHPAARGRLRRDRRPTPLTTGFFDFACRFADRVHLWLGNLDVDADWRPFSLLEAKREADGPPLT